MRTFKLWAVGDAHIGSNNMQEESRKILAEVILGTERGGTDGGPPFDWDIMLDVGDLSGSDTPPKDWEGEDLVAQYRVSTRHPREDFYNIAGNHDGSGPDQPCMGWFRKWADPTGENTEYSGVHADRRPYPIEGTWDRYSFQVGNILFLAMGDRNDGGPPVGRGPRGGYPAGAVTQETYEWWVRMVEANQDKIIVSAHHHMLKETTTGSGPWEGMTGRYHGRFNDGAPEGAGYLYFVGGVPDACKFESYLEAHPGAIDMWIGGHTHTFPDDAYKGRTLIERKWDVSFLNVGTLWPHHMGKHHPMSRLLTFTEGSPEVNVRCYLHTSDYAPQGWYDRVERTLPLRKPFAT